MNEPVFKETPAPVIQLATCDGCGLCVRVCPEGALTIVHQKAVVRDPNVCTYHGYCERICPAQAISRLFQIFLKKEQT